MAWIKRNLFFLIGSLIAVALMVVGIFYLLQQINNENTVTEDIQKQYAELTRLAQLKPHPGNDKIDNIAAAKEQQEALNKYIQKERAVFTHIPSIPDAPSNKVSNADFSRELRNTVAELRRSAQQQSVQLPADYYFTFEAQRKSMIFEPASLDPLASHLGEVKAICDIFFSAKINYLESIQREIISTNQDTNPSDYLARKTVSLPLGDITPYQVTFRCFSAELAQVLANLATSPYGLLAQTIDVEPVGNEMAGNQGGFPGPVPAGQPPPLPYYPRKGQGQPFPGEPPPAAAPAPAVAGRPAAFLNEKPFRVTLLIQVIKPKAPAK